MTSETDLDLLRRFEPVTRYTRREEFVPVNVSFLLWDSRRNDDTDQGIDATKINADASFQLIRRPLWLICTQV